MKKKLLLTLALMCHSAFAADTKEDAFWYYGEYTLQTDSAEAKYFKLDKIVVKKIASPRSSHLVVLNHQVPNSEMGISAQYSKKNERFQFATSDLLECQDHECRGFESASGFFSRGENFRHNLTIKIKFFKDVEGTLKEWTETLEYKSAPSDGAWSW